MENSASRDDIVGRSDGLRIMEGCLGFIVFVVCVFFSDTATAEIYTESVVGGVRCV